jgi:hypothetical protein
MTGLNNELMKKIVQQVMLGRDPVAASEEFKASSRLRV